MAWFTNLASKAESFLENLDQAAASSVEKSGLRKSLRATPDETEPRTDPTSLLSFESDSSLGPSRPARPKASEDAFSSQKVSSSRKQEIPNDEELFQFLNTPSKPSSTIKPRKLSLKEASSGKRLLKSKGPTKSLSSNSEIAQTKQVAGRVETHLTQSDKPGSPTSDLMVQPASPQSTTDATPPQSTTRATPPQSTTRAMPSQSTTEAMPSQSTTDATPPQSTTDATPPQSTTDATPPQSTTEATPPQSTTDEFLQDRVLNSLQMQISNLELEKKLLKREVSSLNEELSETAGELVKLKAENSSFRQENTDLQKQQDELLSELSKVSSQHHNTMQQLDKAVAQLQEQQNQLDQHDKENFSLRQDLSMLTAAKERLAKEVSSASGVQSATLTNLKHQLYSLQDQLLKEELASKELKRVLAEREDEFASKLSVLEEQNETNLVELKRKNESLLESIKALEKVEKDLFALKCEHQDYKQKAAVVLMAKEKEIDRLQHCDASSKEEFLLKQVQERLSASETELSAAKQCVIELQDELKTVGEETEGEVSHLEASLAVADESLVRERASRNIVETELVRVKQDLDHARRELVQQISEMNAEMIKKQEVISSLENQLSIKSLPDTPTPGEGGGDRTELELKLQELTESLIAKQALAETVTGERNSLNIQVDLLQKQVEELKRVPSQQQPAAHVVITGLDSGNQQGGTRMRSIASILPSGESPSSGSARRYVHKAANSVDHISVQVALLLRQYPQARLLLILYVVILHLWVTLVLLTYTPEAH